jgi:ankyrin repeat protein
MLMNECFYPSTGSLSRISALLTYTEVDINIADRVSSVELLCLQLSVDNTYNNSSLLISSDLLLQQDGNTALIYACQSGNRPLVDLLLQYKHKLKVNIKNKVRWMEKI